MKNASNLAGRDIPFLTFYVRPEEPGPLMQDFISLAFPYFLVMIT